MSTIWFYVLKEVSSAHQGCIYLIKNTVNASILWKNITILKKTVFYLNIFENVIYSCDQSWIFSIITPVFSVTWSFRNHSNMLIFCWRNISDYYQCWKQSCYFIFLWKPWYIFFHDSLMIRKFKRTAFISNKKKLL